jgi:B12-binding domain/radical SAM domain protein
MPEPDLVLLHAPSVYDFRQEAILYGPIADFAPAPFVFEIFPLGYASMAEFLEHAGYSVRIANLAKRMLDDPKFDAEDAISALNPIAFGIDFHWLSHAQGALAVAQIAKALHPETPVILGGSAATYYHRELMNYPQVDYVLRGDSTEESLLKLVECLSLRQTPDEVPGLTWRTQCGNVIENSPGLPPDSLDDLPFQGGNITLDCHEGYPVAVGLMGRGCVQNCLTCGGSAYACRRLHGRENPSYRTPELLARDLRDMGRDHQGPVYVPCDITQPGMDYAYRFLQSIRGFPNLLCLDLFEPVPRKFLQDMGDALPRVSLQISIESHDAQVRQATGKSYSNQAVEQTIVDAMSLGCERLDLHFTIGLPHQDYNSVMATVAYCDELLTEYGDNGRLQSFIAPIVPFLDPGSLAFEEPGRNGYHLQFQSLEEHRRALLAPTWKYVLNYNTKWMTGDDIVRATYDVTVAMARLRAKHGLIPGDNAEALEALVNRTRGLMEMIERVVALEDIEKLEQTLRTLKPEIDEINTQAASLTNCLGAPCRKYARRPSSSKRDSNSGHMPRVWGVFKNWWDRRHNSTEEASSEATETHLKRSDTGPRQTGILS